MKTKEELIRDMINFLSNPPKTETIYDTMLFLEKIKDKLDVIYNEGCIKGFEDAKKSFNSLQSKN
jgi:hypothetical protein